MRLPHAIILPYLVVAGTLLLPGCGGINADASLGDDGTGAIADSIAESSAPYVLLDLASGARRTAMELPDLATNARYRNDTMVFRRVGGLDNGYLLGVFEVTQGQWQAIAPAASPLWAGVDPAVVGNGAVAVDRPAFNLSNEDILTGLAGYNAGKEATLGLPSDAQWQHACAAGGDGTWSWGDARDRATILTHALVAETRTGPGPGAVGSLAANPWGFHDMHGNVWEWTGAGDGAHLRGGSWHDAVTLARTANVVDDGDGVVSSTRHALAGLRLVLRQ